MKRVTARACAFLLAVSAHLSAQRIFEGGIVSAANFEPGIAAQSIASVFGTNLSSMRCTANRTPLPTNLCGVSVVFSDAVGNQALAPLFFVSAGQINFQVPISLGRLNFCVGTACTQVLVNLQAPAIFEYERSPGQFDPIVIHADGQLVTPQNLARNGETLILFATGMGLAFRDPADVPLDGEAAPTDRLIRYGGARWIRVSDEIVPVTFAGLAPGFVGLSQFNFRLAREFDPSFRFPTGTVPLRIDDVGVSKTVGLQVGP